MPTDLLMPRNPSSNNATTSRNRFRIIGGKWRGRRLNFPGNRDVRPTPDRVRETLFNWLRVQIVEARCLDLFAGSGALGLEALSRGAARVDFVERDRQVAAGIGGHITALGANASVHVMDAFDFLRSNADTFDVVFLDPPFGHDLARRAFQELITCDVLSSTAQVYLETAPGDLQASLPKGWRLVRESKAGQLVYGLATSNQDNDLKPE